MRQYVWVFVGLAALCLVESRTVQKRETIDPVPHATYDDIFRDKRAVDAKFGVKNAILGFVFNKINSFIDQKTHWIDQLDRTNIEKNRIHGIEPPKDPVTTLSAAISTSIGQKLQAAGPVLSVVASKLTGGSSGGGHTGFNLGSILGGISGHGGAEATASAHAA
ncbi:uncharacterized protein LOC109608911 isoform X2 [Aethina tumida]|uniref:uncharacterized protein LOC109608911 isoform X2 n=1 Tax=Aethina tumida TaxID=116153 RepID=UPI00096AEC57|nr:uncharacterized protein LOC109608911 isoform X2 [Aethina tumida]